MHETAVYRICFQGSLDTSWLQGLGADWTTRFDDDGVTATTTLTGAVRDQAALLGLLGSLYDLQLPLLSVNCLASETDANESAPVD
jgi:hypothetical protein